MRNITKRQGEILAIISKNESVSNKEIKAHLEEKYKSISRLTIIRDLEILIEAGMVVKKGSGRGVVYEEIKNKLLKHFEIETYFKTFPDDRKLPSQTFNFGVFDLFSNNIFSEDELHELEKKNNEFRKRKQLLSPAMLKKEFERLTIELSWKSSQIEGNTYTLIDTEILLLENKESPGHSKEEAIMILNHKKALEYVMQEKNDFKNLTLSKIQNVHSLIVDGLGVQKNIRKRLVGITGTKFKPLDNEFQIKEALGKMVLFINDKKIHPLVKALSAVLLVSYIQPFEDGNKRTARILGNAVLLAHDYCPLSYRSINEADYKKATLLFYEQNSARFFKELFVEQFKFAVDTYFLA